MHTTDISSWKHEHDFGADNSSAEKRTRRVIVLTAAWMMVEIIAGFFFHSMALVADGWHMCTHVAAFVLTALAYSFCRRHAKDERFSFGTGKIGVLGGFTSAIVLGADGTVYVGVTNGYTYYGYQTLYSFGPDGSPNWLFGIPGGGSSSSPVTSMDGTVYMGGWNGCNH